jgi:hypothetical protein
MNGSGRKREPTSRFVSGSHAVNDAFQQLHAITNYRCDPASVIVSIVPWHAVTSEKEMRHPLGSDVMSKRPKSNVASTRNTNRVDPKWSVMGVFPAKVEGGGYCAVTAADLHA